MLLRTYYTFFGKFHMDSIFQKQKIWLDPNVQSWDTQFELPPFWMVWKQTSLKRILNNAKFIFMEKQILKKKTINLLFTPQKFL